MKMSRGGTKESRTPPRRQAARMPSTLPMTTAMISDTKPSRNVQPMTLEMTSITGVGNREIEKPRLPVKIWPR
ncbi:hypothetical protein D3C72_2464330 [compost metagenome]